MENEEPKGFQIRDRRRFTETGEARPEAPDAPDAPEAPEERAAPAAEAPPRGPWAPTGEAVGPEHEPTHITFSTFLISLSTQALMLLGEIPNPATGRMETDLTGVQELIDLIGMLQEKTRGNLDTAETQLTDNILYDLRMRYVEKVRK